MKLGLNNIDSESPLKMQYDNYELWFFVPGNLVLSVYYDGDYNAMEKNAAKKLVEFI